MLGQLPGPGALKAQSGKHGTSIWCQTSYLIPDVAELDLTGASPLLNPCVLAHGSHLPLLCPQCGLRDSRKRRTWLSMKIELQSRERPHARVAAVFLDNPEKLDFHRKQ